MSSALATAYVPLEPEHLPDVTRIYAHDVLRSTAIFELKHRRTLDACHAAGKRQVIAVIGGSANAESIALHASRGFAHAGVLRDVGFKFGRYIDTVLMQRTL